MDPSLRTLLTDVVTVEQATGGTGTGYGKITFADPVSYYAHIEERRQFTRTSGGDLIETSRTIYIAGRVDLSPEDRLTLPDGSTPRIVASVVHRGYDAFDGGWTDEHTEVRVA